MGRTANTIMTGTAAAGTLDLLSAFVFGGMDGVGPIRILKSITSGPFGHLLHGPAAAATGLVTHYALMAIMVTVFVLAAERLPLLVRHPVLAGLAYGIGLYLVMYWVVLPARFPTAFPNTELWPVANALFSHMICVGLPIGLLTARAHRRV